MIEELRNVPVRKLIRALERDGFVYRRPKAASGCIGIPMVGESSSTTIMAGTRYLPVRFDTFSQPLSGMRTLSVASVCSSRLSLRSPDVKYPVIQVTNRGLF